MLNWNGWADTLECLESVFRAERRSGPVVLCDNASDDASLDRISAWAEGKLDVALPPTSPLRRLVAPPVRKPIAYVRYDRPTAEAGGDPRDAEVPLVLIQTGANLGFAGGNNVALRYLLGRGDCDTVWLLNNDTVVEPDSLRHLQAVISRDSRVGMAGSTLLYYNHPAVVQAFGGGSYNPWLALPRHIGENQSSTAPVDVAEVERRLAFVAGASLLVRCDLLREVGLLNERYFLYFEELDLALRARGKYTLAYAPESRVYHKEGASIGTHETDTGKSLRSDYYFLRNRILLARRFTPRKLPTVYAALLLALLRRIGRGQWDRWLTILKICFRT